MHINLYFKTLIFKKISIIVYNQLWLPICCTTPYIQSASSCSMNNFHEAKKSIYSLMSRKFSNHDDCKNIRVILVTLTAYLYNHLHLITLTLNTKLYYYNSDVAIF